MSSSRGRVSNRRQRLQVLEIYFQDIFQSKTSYPTVTELARKTRVTPSTTYRDLETLRSKLGPFIIPIRLKLGGKKHE